MIRYELKIPHDCHWDSLWDEMEVSDNSKFPNYVDAYLKKYNGRVYLDEDYTELKVVKGIEFKTTEDLLFFKLKFN